MVNRCGNIQDQNNFRVYASFALLNCKIIMITTVFVKFPLPQLTLFYQKARHTLKMIYAGCKATLSTLLSSCPSDLCSPSTL